MAVLHDAAANRAPHQMGRAQCTHDAAGGGNVFQHLHACVEQVRLASVRRSLFTGETERSAFLARLVTGTRDVLRSNQGLAEHANYHEFCRLLGRLKTNYQLSELVRSLLVPPAQRCSFTCDHTPSQWHQRASILACHSCSHRHQVQTHDR